MRRKFRRYPPSVDDSTFKEMTDLKISIALDVLFGLKVNIDRNLLTLLGWSQHTLNLMSDREVRRYDLSNWAHTQLRYAIVSLVLQQQLKTIQEALNPTTQI